MTFSCMLLTAALLVPTQPAPAPDPAVTALSEARVLLNEGHATAALARLQPLDASDPRVRHLRGVAYYHANDPVRALEQLAPLASAFPEDSVERREIVQVLGLSHYMAGHLADALPLLEQTRRWAPGNLELGYVLGTTYLQTRQPAKARHVFASTYGVAPESAAAYLLNAQMMVRLELEELAEPELRAALEKDQALPHANFLLGQIAIFRARLDEAIALLDRELAVNPANAMALYRLGDAYGRQLKWDAAIAALQKSIWINPFFSGPYILLGKAYLRRNQPEAAEGMLRRAIQYDPNNRSAHYLLGQLLQQTGRTDEAKQEFAIAEKLQNVPDR